MDNVMIERLWRSLKYECVYLQAFDGGSEARKGIGEWIRFYDERRPHSRLDGRTPDEVYMDPGGRGSNWTTPYWGRQPIQTMGTTSPPALRLPLNLQPRVSTLSWP